MQANKRRALGAAETVVGDRDDDEAWAAAVEDAAALYYICPNMEPNDIDIAMRVIHTEASLHTARLEDQRGVTWTAVTPLYLYHHVLLPKGNANVSSKAHPACDDI